MNLVDSISFPFAYVRHFLQLTLLSFIVQNFISIWVICSLYYFLPRCPFFARYVLLIMWKTYNLSLLEVIGVEAPELFTLNHQESKMVYGDVELPIDFMSFAFDPLMTIGIGFANYLLFLLLRSAFRRAFQKDNEPKISWLGLNQLEGERPKVTWLKFSFFESIGEVVIELLPVLFLPAANFVFHPFFGNVLEKINMALFSTLAAFGVIFPFFYSSTLMRRKVELFRQHS